jgi:hypothetical protein
MKFGDRFALPIVGNFDPPVTPGGGGGGGGAGQYDVNVDGTVNVLDLVDVISRIVASGPGVAPAPALVGGMNYDVNTDGDVNTMDMVDLINYLVTNASPAPAAPQDALLAEEGEGEGAESDDLLLLLAMDQEDRDE